MILKKRKSYFEEEVAKNRNKPEELWKALKSLGQTSDKARKPKIFLKKDGKFNLKHWKTQILSKSSTLNQPEASKKNCQMYPTNLLAKQPKPTTPRLHATFPMTELSNVSEKVIKKILISLDTSEAVGW